MEDSNVALRRWSGTVLDMLLLDFDADDSDLSRGGRQTDRAYVHVY